MLGLPVLGLLGPVQAADLSCAPSPVAGQAVVALGRAANLQADSPARMLDLLARSRLISPETVSRLKVALAQRRMPAATYQLFLADLAGGPAPAPAPQQAAQMLLRRGAVLPLQACLNASELRALLSGERTALDDSYRTPAARTRP